MRGQLAARLGHVGDYVAHGRSDLRTVQTQLLALVLQAALAHCRQRSVLHAHAARIDQLQRVQIDLLLARDFARFTGRAGRAVGRVVE